MFKSFLILYCLRKTDRLLIINHILDGPYAFVLFSIERKGSGCLKSLGAAKKILYPTVYWEKEVLKYFRFCSTLAMRADRSSKRRMPGFISSLYSCQLTHPHYITLRLPLKVILPEHNHTQSKPQTSYITKTVNGLRVYILLPQKCFRSIHKLKLG